MFNWIVNIASMGKGAEKRPVSFSEVDRFLAEIRPRSQVKAQMLKMAAWYGLSEKRLARLGWRLPLVIEACDKCAVQAICFKDKFGAPSDTPNIRKHQCPNAQVYLDEAENRGNRSQLRKSI